MYEDARKLDDKVSVAPQPTPDDFADIARAGFKSIINNRPDGEEPGQLPHAEAQKIAQAHGLNYVYIPVTSATLGPDAVEAFTRAVDELPGPVLAHCRSGTRCTVLWALSEARRGDRTPDDLIATAAEQGYDIGNLRPALERLANGEG